MSDVDEGVILPLETLFAAIPGGTYPLGRAIICGVAGGGFAHYVKPLASYTPEGQTRAWIVLEPENPDAAVFPWWGFAVLPAAVGGLLI